MNKGTASLIPALPQAYIDSLLPLLQSEMEAFLASYLDGPVRGIRFAVKKNVRMPNDFPDPIPWAKNAWYCAPGSNPGSHPLHDAGAYYLQEPSAMAPVAALNPQPGDVVLDLCAAPGSKATQIAGLLEGKGALLANETNAGRAKVLSQNLERMGVPNAAVSCETPERLAQALTGAFDKVLVDAPCSGEGMFRRDTAARLQWTRDTSSGCAQRQRLILASAARLLRPGGVLAYSTCTFNRQENEEVVEDFLKSQPSFSLLPFSLPGLTPSENGMLRIWPHQVRGEGQFVALMKKSGDSLRQVFPSRTPTQDELPIIAQINQAISCWVTDPFQADAVFGVHAVMRPRDLPCTDGLHILRLGLALGSLQGNTPRPEHALALAAIARYIVPLHEADARLYLQGHPLQVAAELNGWVTPALDGYPLGWGKVSNGVMKNHYPRGLRRPL